MNGVAESEIPNSLGGRWRDLGDRAIFRITGPDRVRYLNGQVTNQMDGPPERGVVPACLCTVKGKVEALVWVRADGESLILDGEGCQREALLARLERYLISDDCEVEDVSDHYRLLHHFIGDSGGGMVCRRARFLGRDLLLSRDEVFPFPDSEAISDQDWECEEVLARIPKSGFEFHGEEFPAELGLDEWAVDFHKGCYLGQEIVSRIRSVGKVKRSLRVVVAERSLSQGEEITLPEGESGTVTRSSVCDSEGRHLSLAIFKAPLPEDGCKTVVLPLS
ncbi:MAG: hypothetical protein KDN18_14745 [Verrucomicrobiae bacterium]|nr:hypothetical protein [Verrucomicrobiae bacterium]